VFSRFYCYIVWCAAADALQNGSGATLDLGRELSLAMALQFPAAHEAAPDAQQSPARPAGSPSGQVRRLGV